MGQGGGKARGEREYVPSFLASTHLYVPFRIVLDISRESRALG
jgi:hypothetical protein